MDKEGREEESSCETEAHCPENDADDRINLLYTRYPIVARALGLAAMRASKGILHTN